VIHVMAVARLGLSTVAAAVMGDDAIAVIEEEQHLRVPVIGRQRPPMAEHDGLTFAPILVKDIDTVLGRDRAHLMSSFAVIVVRRSENNSVASPADRPLFRRHPLVTVIFGPQKGGDVIDARHGPSSARKQASGTTP
jgi:hypothetical protein